VHSEFNAIDSWDTLDNPHGLTDTEEMSVNERLYRNKNNVISAAEFRPLQGHSVLVVAVEILQ